MADEMSKEQRSRLMARIRGKDAAPEMTVRSSLHAQRLRFRLHVRALPGRPDIVLPRFGVCTFVNGCFWHAHKGCLHARIPNSNTLFWREKFQRTRERDLTARAALKRLGWRVIDVWECGLKDVRVPSLGWLEREVRFGDSSHVQWPRRPRKLRANSA